MARNDVIVDSRAAASCDVASMNIKLEKFSYTYSSLVRQTSFSDKAEKEATAVFESSVTVRIAENLVIRMNCHEMIGTRPCHLCEFCVTN